jgi:WD40 repeat protein
MISGPYGESAFLSWVRRLTLRPWARRLTLIVAVLALAVTVTVIVLRDLGQPKLIATLREPGGQRAKAAAFSPDGKMLAVLGRNGDTYVWDVVSGRWTATLTSPQCRGDDAQILFSPDGKTLAVIGAANGDTCLWDVATRRQAAVMTEPNNHSTGVTGGAFSPDGTTLAIGDSNGSIYLWDVASRRQVATLTDPARNDGGPSVQAVAFSPGGKMLAVVDGMDDSTYLWDVATRRLVATLADDRVLKDCGVSMGGVSLAFVGDGALAVGDTSGCVYVWDVATAHLVMTLALPVNVLEVNPLFYCSQCSAGGMLEPLNANSVSPPNGLFIWVNLASSRNGEVLATGNDLGYGTGLWSVTGRAAHHIATLTDPGGDNVDAPQLAMSPDGSMLAVVDGNGRTYLWQLHSVGTNSAAVSGH